ncbi:MAG: LbtU family siderophore porin, partial [Proteobacteria bacterium]|nr:LbtU family siderophore porin [Pseudomonadota bacterium]
GLYASNMISAPLTQSIGRILTRAVRIGYLERGAQGTSVTGFIFNSDTAVGSRLEGGADITYKWDGALNGDIGVSFVSNISDSQGMQSTGGPGAFTGFGMSTATDTLVHRVPGIDVHSKLNFKKFGFLAEYVSGLRPFAMQDMSFNGHGATPSAFNLEASYSFDLFNKPASFALGYGQSYQGLALNLAKNRYSGVFNISLFRNTIQSLEYRHDVNYGTGTTASGAGLPITSAGLGRHQDLLLFQMGVYF